MMCSGTMGESRRLFVSVNVPVTDPMREAISELAGIRNVRTEKADKIHITLCFLGDTDVRRIPELRDRLRDSLSSEGRIRIRLRGVGAFPDIRRPRVVWIGIESDTLAAISAKVRKAAEDCRLDFDSKPFSPHVTIGRVNGRADITEYAGVYRYTMFAEFEADSVRLMASELLPTGAKHTVVERFPLQ